MHGSSSLRETYLNENFGDVVDDDSYVILFFAYFGADPYVVSDSINPSSISHLDSNSNSVISLLLFPSRELPSWVSLFHSSSSASIFLLPQTSPLLSLSSDIPSRCTHSWLRDPNLPQLRVRYRLIPGWNLLMCRRYASIGPEKHCSPLCVARSSRENGCVSRTIDTILCGAGGCSLE